MRSGKGFIKLLCGLKDIETLINEVETLRSNKETLLSILTGWVAKGSIKTEPAFLPPGERLLPTVVGARVCY